MFLLDSCIIPDTTGMTQAWFTPLLFDAAYLHALCFTVQTYFDGFFGRTRTLEAQRRDRVHYAKTVRILQERLAYGDDWMRLTDSTVMTILALSGHAYTTGDYESASNHISGLLKLVNMRGVITFCHNTKLSIEIVRSDLGMALDRSSKPLLANRDGIPWPLVPTCDSMTLPDDTLSSRQPLSDVESLLGRLDPELAAVWTAMSQFCDLINAAAEKGEAAVTENAFLHSMGSVMYRLLYQRFQKGSLDEAFRLGLLAFSSPIFLHWNRVELPDHLFTSAYRQALAELNLAGTKVASRELLWLAMVGALSMSHESDGMAMLAPCLREQIDQCEVVTWDGMRHLLSSFLWVGFVYDRLVRKLHNPWERLIVERDFDWRL